MKAMQFAGYGGPERLTLNVLDRPEPAPGEIRVAIHATSINPIDWKLHGGMLRWVKSVKFPSTPCFDFAGIVDALGPSVSQFSPGDRVFGMLKLGNRGAAAEQVCVDATLVARWPNELDLQQAAGLPLAGMTALQGLRDYGELKPGMNVLVVGASGGVGHYAVQLGKILGTRVTAICSERNRGLVEELGADEVLNYQSPNFSLTRGRCDIILDCVSTAPLGAWLPALSTRGRYVSLLPRLEMALQIPRLALFTHRRARLALVTPLKADLEFLAGQARQGRLRTVIEKVFPLSELGSALAQSRAGRTRGKLIILTHPG